MSRLEHSTRSRSGSFVHRRDQLLVLQNQVGMFHPLFAQIAYLFRDETFAKLKLLSAPFMRVAPSRGRRVRLLLPLPLLAQVVAI
jgi:hypothetical protein